jgi:hypothetical protein
MDRSGRLDRRADRAKRGAGPPGGRGDASGCVGVLDVALRVRWQVRAAEGADEGGAVLDPREGHRILLAAQEALGAVDGIERPEAFVAGFRGAVADRLEDVFGRRFGKDHSHRGGDRFQHRAARLAFERGGMLLTDQSRR